MTPSTHDALPTSNLTADTPLAQGPGGGSAPPVLALVGGFLGAGKTTLIGRTVARLHQQGLRCAVVSNDQSVGLVDGLSARLLGGAAVGEVTGACFCCKLDDLAQVVERLRAEDRPDVILCEPVGSCTDLVSTVVRPLEKIYRMDVGITPFTVVLDARRAMAAFGGVKRKKDFAKDVGYIFRKQVEEAEALFLNKVEVLTAAEREALHSALEKAFPEKRLWFGSAKADEGVSAWMEGCLGVEEHKGGSLASSLTERRYSRSMDIDYGVYARGEAMLGWYNAELSFRAGAPLDGNAWLLARAEEIAGKLEDAGCEVAHFKMSLEKTRDGETRDARKEKEPRAAIVNQVMSGEKPTLSTTQRRMCFNARNKPRHFYWLGRGFTWDSNGNSSRTRSFVSITTAELLLRLAIFMIFGISLESISGIFPIGPTLTVGYA